MNTQSIIAHPDFGQVRVELINEEPWFCAKDVCDILGYTNESKAIGDHCRTPWVTKRYLGVKTGLKSDGTAAIQQVEMTFINEGNLYRLILRSKMPAAVKFEAWVCDEVLPSIRKFGCYPPQRATKYVVLSQPELDKDFEDLMLRLIVKVPDLKLRNRMVGILDFYLSKRKRQQATVLECTGGQ